MQVKAVSSGSNPSPVSILAPWAGTISSLLSSLMQFLFLCLDRKPLAQNRLFRHHDLLVAVVAELDGTGRALAGAGAAAGAQRRLDVGRADDPPNTRGLVIDLRDMERAGPHAGQTADALDLID